MAEDLWFDVLWRQEFRSSVVPAQPPDQWIQGTATRGYRVKESVELYLHSLIRLHGVVLDWHWNISFI